MKLVWTAVLALVAAAALNEARASGPSRFASYDTEADCVAARTFAPAACHIAFANARFEYEVKTPSFASEALCTKRYASCMAWPPGAPALKASFRPAWDGVDIVDTPREHSVTPSSGSAGKAIRFAARPLTEEPPTLVIRGAGVPPPPPLRGGVEAPLIAGRPGRPNPAPGFIQRAGNAPERPLPPSAPPVPGSGFKLEDGVLTYPAPERFQPRNLPKVN